MLSLTESLYSKGARLRSSVQKANLRSSSPENRKFQKKRKKNYSNLPIREKIGSKRPIDFKKTLYNKSVLFFKKIFL